MRSAILEDTRNILAATLAFSQHAETFQVGQHGIERIEVYSEPGLHCELPWLAIFFEGHDEPRVRVPAAACLIEWIDERF